MAVSSKTHRHKVKITMKQEGKKLSFHQKEIEKMRREIKEDLSIDVQQVMKEN